MLLVVAILNRDHVDLFLGLEMAFINYVSEELIPEKFRVPDQDNIIQIHSVHPSVMKLHYELYVDLMHRESDWSRVQREMVAVVVSSINQCHY